MGSTTFVAAAAAVLLLLEAPIIVVEANASCPVSSDFSNDGHLYVTNTDELTEECQCFSAENKDLCTSVTNTTSNIGILGDFECGGTCHGFVMNPEYVFWDVAQNDWKALDACGDMPSLLTCDDMDQGLDCDVSYCANGVFKCQQPDGTVCGGIVQRGEQLPDCPSKVSIAAGATAMNTLEYIFAEEGAFDVKIHGIHNELYTAITHYRTCNGKLDYTFDTDGNHCPPKTVSSYEEIEHYCMHGDIGTFGDGRYKCEWDDLDPCQGTIDPTLVPACKASTIASCADEFYYEACTHEVVGTGRDSGGEPEFRKFCSGAAFHCWDRRADEWCQGKVVPTFGSFKEPVCPSVVPSCDSLEQFGINHRDCSCFDMNGFGGFVCGDWDKPYCKGDVDESTTIDDAEFTTIADPPAWSESPGSDTPNDKPTTEHNNESLGSGENDVVFSRNDTNPMKRSATLIPLFLASAVALVAVAFFSVGYKRYKAKKKVAMRREDLAAALELTAHYRGDEDIDFIQHPRRLMIL